MLIDVYKGWNLPLVPRYSTVLILKYTYYNAVVAVTTDSTNFKCFISYGFEILITSSQYLSARREA